MPADRSRTTHRPARLFKVVAAGGVPAEWGVPPGVDPDAVLLYLHGGGYVVGSQSLTALARLAGGGT